MPPSQPPPSPPSETDLPTLLAQATQAYALKNYPHAANLYSRATTLQTEQRGEMDPENADLLYAYGRCLYHVAVGQSDVLGGKVAAEKKEKTKKSTKGTGKGKKGVKDEKVAAEIVEAVVGAKEGHVKTEGPASAANKPYFQISGDDADWDSSEDEDGEDGAATADAEDEADAAAEEEEDDFATAYEILDVARVLFLKKLETVSQTQGDDGKGKGKEVANGKETRQIKDRLADTHDLQGEISLENERFADAVIDSRAALVLKQEIYPQESSIVAEAHFKLSLALEFASVTTQKGADGEVEAGKEAQVVDDGMRKEAAEQMEAAIASSRLRIEKENGNIASLSEEDATKKKKELDDVKEIIQEMEQRLEELRNPAVSLNGVTGSAGAPDESDALKGILGSLLGESPAAQKARIEEVTKSANDLTGLIRHKKKAPVVPEPVVKRKAATVEDDDEEDELAGPAKKVKSA